jgi:hypothetical protein
LITFLNHNIDPWFLWQWIAAISGVTSINIRQAWNGVAPEGQRGVLAVRDRFDETPFRPKSFWTNFYLAKVTKFHPENADKNYFTEFLALLALKMNILEYL